jgi:nucleoside transporter
MASASSPYRPPLALGLRINLSVMMFLQFAVWGSWFVLFVPYLKSRGFSSEDAGDLFGTMALGAIISTVFAGYIADRFFASEKLMAVLHLAGAGLLYWMASIPGPGEDENAFLLMFAASLGYALVYNPTLALANSIAFTHVPDGQRDFPGIRVLGTLGWIAVGFLVDLMFSSETQKASESNGPLLLAAGLSAVLAAMSLFLPHTPPAGRGGDALPFVKALGLFKDFSFAVFFIVSFVITIVLAFYYTFTADYLQQHAGVTKAASVMSIGQICELILLPFLPVFLFRMGMKWVLALGMFAWGLRYFLFSQGGPWDPGSPLPFILVIIGVALHGICFDFFFAAGFIHVDNEAPKEIRASAQALFSFLTYGLGMWLGNMLSGRIVAFYTDETTKTVDWASFWMVPSIGVLISLAVFVLFFRMRPNGRPTAAGAH